MKSLAFLAVFAVAVMVASLAPSAQASPVALIPENADADPAADAEALLVPEPYVEARADRQARVTCDLLSFESKWVTPNHAACAAHCLVLGKGFKGGSCKNAVCVCRK